MRLPLTAEASITEEPGAVVPHAGICAGRSGNRPLYGGDKVTDFVRPEEKWGDMRSVECVEL